MRVGAAGDKGLLFSLSPPHQGSDGEWRSDKSGVIVYRWKRSWQQAQHRPHQLEGEVELLPARSATRKRRRAAAGANCQLPRTSPTTIWIHSLLTTRPHQPAVCIASFFCNMKLLLQNAATLVSIRRGGVKCRAKLKSTREKVILRTNIMV